MNGSSPAPSYLRLYLLIGLMTTFWSINYVFAKIALRELPALVTTGMRNCIAGILMVPLYILHRRRSQNPLWSRGDLPVLFGLGLCGVALNQIFFILGIARTDVAHASLMIATTPMLVLLMAAILGQERITMAKLTGLLTAAAGVAVLQFSSASGRGGATLAGDALVFLAALTFAIFSVGGKRVTSRFSSITLNTFAYGSAGLVLIPVTVWASQPVAFDQVSARVWWSLAYMAVFSSIVCYLIYYYALQFIPASRVSAFSYLQPVIATTAAIPVLGEQPGAAILAGGALVLIGVFVAERF